MMIKRNILILFMVTLFFGCQPTEEKGSGSSGNLSVSVAGFQNFGKIAVGTSSLSGIKVTNASSSASSLNIVGLEAPFYFHRIKGDCTQSSIPANATCTIQFRFTPSSPDQVQRAIGVNGNTFDFVGKGLDLGSINYTNNQWDAGTIQAGQIIERVFEVTNNGDDSLSDFLTETDTFAIKTNTCGELFDPGETCTVTVTTQKALVGTYNDTIELFSTDNPTKFPINFTATVIAAEPFGTIGINCTELKLMANNTDQSVCTTNAITDSFGNVVDDIHVVSASVSGIAAVTSTTQTTSNGIVSFTIRATNAITTGRLVLNSGSATGFVDFNVTSGPPTGSITFQPYNQNVYADGTSVVTVETNTLYNSLGQIVSNAEDLFVSLTGPGTVLTPNILSFNGTSLLSIQSTTTDGLVTVTVNSDPIYDGDGNITGYNGAGSFTINMNPVPLPGNFNVTSDSPSIYFDKTGSGHDDEAQITVGPILNIHDNLIGPGIDVEISINNGQHVSTLQNSFTLTTDANSEVSFPVRGIGVRGDIIINAVVDGLGASFTLKAVGETNNKYSESASLNSLSLFYQYEDSRFTTNMLSPLVDGWIPVKDNYQDVTDQDADYYGDRRVFGKWEDVGFTGRHYIWDCMIPVRNFVMSTPCADKSMADGNPIYYYYFPYLMDFNDINTPIRLNGNISGFPNENSGFGDDVINPVSLYDSIENRAIMFGGATITENTGRYYLTNNINYLSYSQISVFAHTPLGGIGFTNEIAFPMFPSHSNKQDKVFFFGGLHENTGVITAGNVLQKFEVEDLETLAIGDGANGSPGARYQNAVHYDEKENRVYVIGGLNLSDVVYDDIWYTDLDDLTPTWTRVCDSCGLPDYYTKRINDLVFGVVSGFPTRHDALSVDNIRHVQTAYVAHLDKVLMYKYNSNMLYELNLSTGVSSEYISADLDFIKLSDAVLYHEKLDRFYKQNVENPNYFTSKYYFYDGGLGKMNYYMATIDLGDNAHDYALEIRPTISAFSENNSGGVTEYGAEAYAFNHTTLVWDKIGENTNSDVSSIENSSFDIKTTLTNPTNYVDSSGNINLLIKPLQEVGFQGGITAEPGDYRLQINHILIEGIY